MKYDQIKELSEEQFRRLTGDKKATLKRIDFFQNFKQIEHKDTKTQRHEEVY